jgi:pimeloyl-ACP methyl ester carboxylesterase
MRLGGITFSPASVDRRHRLLAAALLISTLLALVFGPSVSRASRTLAIAFELLWFAGDGPLSIQTPSPIRSETVLTAGGQEFAVDIYDIGGFRREVGLVLINGIEPAGRRYEPLVELAQTLARVGITVAVPDLTSYVEYRLDPADVVRLRRTYLFLLDELNVDPARSGFLGFSAGGSLAFVAAADPQIAESVGVIALVGPYSDLTRVLSFATTGAYRTESALIQYRPEVLVWQVARNTVLSTMSDSGERAFLRRVFDGRTPEPDAEFLAENPGYTLSAEGQATFDLFANRDPAAVADLTARLPDHSRQLLTDLSPTAVTPLIHARLLLMHEGGDPYFPLYESEELIRLMPVRSMLISTALIEHAVLRTPPLTPGNIFNFYLPESVKLLNYIYFLLEATGR